ESRCSIRPLLQRLCLPSQVPLFTFFGTLHNFEPSFIVNRLRSILESSESLLLSANLAPAASYEESLAKLLAGYDNDLARDWLWAFLLENGFKRSDGEIQFCIEPSPEQPLLKRFVAYFQIQTECRVTIRGHSLAFAAGQKL